eukprot:CAMPEP_0178377536 /NCGR_PEP_ID=MMETSP0689_2-20121128/3969_1 /TAXON_ID=160604 /ORGANISM="Amphidinium massartii, Strain CS-259" /LENGTH=136 /DNA_ID=CAMNT_0019997593 /DNA_START=1 /DNA_END=411 /DNA_ORIENTATION=+
MGNLPPTKRVRTSFDSVEGDAGLGLRSVRRLVPTLRKPGDTASTAVTGKLPGLVKVQTSATFVQEDAGLDFSSVCCSDVAKVHAVQDFQLHGHALPADQFLAAEKQSRFKRELRETLRNPDEFRRSIVACRGQLAL